MNIDTIFLHDFLIFISCFLPTYCVALWLFNKYVKPPFLEVRLIFSGRDFIIVKTRKGIYKKRIFYNIYGFPSLINQSKPNWTFNNANSMVDIKLENKQDLYKAIVCHFDDYDLARLRPELMQKVIPLLSDRRVAAVMAVKLS